MSDDNVDWVTVEEQLVHIETSGLLLKSHGDKSSSDLEEGLANNEAVHFVDLESEEPILQIGRQIFAGYYVDPPETSLFFRCRQIDSTSTAVGVDPAFPRNQARLSAKLECKANKKLRFKRIFLKPKAKSWLWNGYSTKRD